MNLPVGTSSFQLGVPPDEDAAEEVPLLHGMAREARAYVGSFRWARPIKELLLAFGVPKICALFLVRFASGLPGEGEGDTECWVVVGDLPYMYFETDAQTPAEALRLYCAIAEDWIDKVLTGQSLAESYPIPVAPTREHAEMLKGRVEFITEKLIPLAGAKDRISGGAARVSGGHWLRKGRRSRASEVRPNWSKIRSVRDIAV